MVFTGNQTTAFFEDNDQMGLVNRTRVFLQSEGITDVEDLSEFTTKDSWSQLLENCKRPPQVTDAAGNLVSQAAFRIGAKSLRRLKVAAKCVKYYQDTGRDLSANNMMWSTRLSAFEVSWKALEDAKEKDPTNKLPILTRNFPIDKWLESYHNYADQRIGVRTCPLTYILREDSAVPAVAPALGANVPYSAMHGSLRNEQIARYSHNHSLYSVDNASVFDDIEEATRGSRYQSSITTFKKHKNGRGAYLALREQFTGPAVWDKKKATSMEFLQSRKFTGTTNTTLEAFLGQHRSAYVTLERCAEHVHCQLPDDRSRVQFLLENIQVEDANVKAALSSVRLDDTPNGMRNNFEATVAFLLPTDPVEKKKARNKRPIADVAATEAEEDESEQPASKKLGNLKTGRGSTGVEFRYYKPKEFNKLTKEQKNELLEHRKKHGLTGKEKKKSKPRSIASVVRSTIKKMEDEKNKTEEENNAMKNEIRDLLVAAMQSRPVSAEAATKAGVSAVGASVQPPASKQASDVKTIRFAQGTAPPACADPFQIDSAAAEGAATKLMKVMYSMSKGGGKKKGSH